MTGPPGPAGRSAGAPVQCANVSAAEVAAGAEPWILTGMSGAGKAAAGRALETAGATVVDNVPLALLDPLLALPRTAPLVVVVDGRRGDELAGFVGTPRARVLFLDAPDAVLVRRLADSTRPHPCAASGTGRAAVAAERALLVPLRAAADVVIDTGALTETEMTDRVLAAVLPGGAHAGDFRLSITSFGFKYGPEAEADWVIDSRILANPFWETELRPLTGLDEKVRAFVLARPDTVDLLERSGSLLEWVIATARSRGRAALHVAVGCTGGRHRSVVVAAELADRLRGDGISVALRHRDAHRPDPR